jgi:hypothetical protein
MAVSAAGRFSIRWLEKPTVIDDGAMPPPYTHPRDRNPDLRQPLHMEGTPRSIFGAILPLFYVAWWLYPIAYAAPVLLRAGVSYELTIVSQQVVYTIADIASKVVYGVMLSVTATMLSEKQGYSRI